MDTNGFRQLLPHEGAFDIPPEQYLIMSRIPHHGQRIELTIERTLFIDAAGAGLAIEGGTQKTSPLRIRNDNDLTSGPIRKCPLVQTAFDGPGNFLTRKVGSKRAVGIGKPAADI